MLTLVEAARMLRGRGGRAPHVETVRKWVRRGVRLPGGEVLRLKASRVGGEWFFLPQDLKDFEARRWLAGLGLAG